MSLPSITSDNLIFIILLRLTTNGAFTLCVELNDLEFNEEKLL